MLQKYLLVCALLLVVIGTFEFYYYLHQYYIHENKHQPWCRNYAAKELKTIYWGDGTPAFKLVQYIPTP